MNERRPKQKCLLKAQERNVSIRGIESVRSSASDLTAISERVHMFVNFIDIEKCATTKAFIPSQF